MYKQYKLVFVLAIIISCIFFTFFVFYDQYTQNLDKENYKNFLAGTSLYTPVKNNLPGEQNVVYNEINALAPKNNLILVGSSTTREGVLPDQINLPNNWTLHNFALSRVTVYSTKIMLNYLNNYANHNPDKSDIIVLHIDCSVFSDLPPEDDYTKQNIEGTGIYYIDKEGNIYRNLIYPPQFFSSRVYTLREIYSSFKPKFESYLVSNLRYLKNGNNKNVVQVTKLNSDATFWKSKTINASFPGESTMEFKRLISQLKNQTNVVVVNMYISSWNRNSPKDQEYEKWVVSDLVPFLEEENVTFIDYSSSIPDSEFGDDSAHLFRDGRQRYTKLFNENIATLIVNRGVEV